jgi:hypothetical protein
MHRIAPFATAQRDASHSLALSCETPISAVNSGFATRPRAAGSQQKGGRAAAFIVLSKR